MIDKLEIRGFMGLKKLDIPILKRVNLIAGKNNSGKTTLLDAIRILESDGEDSVVNNILESRNSFKEGRSESYKNLFFRNGEVSKLSINELEIKQNLKDSRTFDVDNIFGTLASKVSSNDPIDKVVYVPINSNYATMSTLWENINLTPGEDDVINIVKEAIEPTLIRLDVGSNFVKVRLNNTQKPVPLKTLGDGVYRILLIALSLANAKNKILLIDEIELGLHYSTLETLWQMIFKYSKKWNIQVFATTHSQDTIRAFQYVASDEKYISDAEYIRLQISRKGENEAIVFDGDRLKDSLKLELEIR